MMSNSKFNVRKLVGAAVLAAIIVVLQLVVSSIHVGPFSITLALIPIIIGAIVYGPGTGAGLGAVFGLVVCYAVVTGADWGGFLLFQEKPVITLIVCIAKSTVAGYVAGVVNRACERREKPKLGAVLAAILCPICNTGILSIAMLTVFNALVSQWAVAAGSASLVGYVVVVVVGINFLIELAINLILVPVINRVLRAVKRD